MCKCRCGPRSSERISKVSMLGSIALLILSTELSFRLANPSLSCLPGWPASLPMCEKCRINITLKQIQQVSKTRDMILIRRRDTGVAGKASRWDERGTVSCEAGRATWEAGSLVPQPSECLFQGLVGKRSSLHRGWSHWNFANLTWQESRGSIMAWCQILVERGILSICLDILQGLQDEKCCGLCNSFQRLWPMNAAFWVKELSECLCLMCLMSRGVLWGQCQENLFCLPSPARSAPLHADWLNLFRPETNSYVGVCTEAQDLSKPKRTSFSSLKGL